MQKNEIKGKEKGRKAGESDITKDKVKQKKQLETDKIKTGNEKRRERV